VPGERAATERPLLLLPPPPLVFHRKTDTFVCWPFRGLIAVPSHRSAAAVGADGDPEHEFQRGYQGKRDPSPRAGRRAGSISGGIGWEDRGGSSGRLRGEFLRVHRVSEQERSGGV